MIEKFYTDYAEYYDLICQDRDFGKQMDFIKTIFQKTEPPAKNFNVVELFAGSAYHSIEAARDKNLDVWAIDSSKEMKSIAIEKGFENQKKYIHDLLPDGLDDIAPGEALDCVLCLRYSLGYLDRKNVYELLKKLSTRLSDQGKIFIELHDISCIVNNMSDTDILVRKMKGVNGENIQCTWPDGSIKWNSENFLAKMDVSLAIEHSDGQKEQEKFISKETIYCADEISFLANLVGLECYNVCNLVQNPQEVNGLFFNSILILLTKKTL